MKNHIYAAGLFVIMLASDIISKYYIDLNLAEHERIYIIGKYFQIIKIYNRGGVFGIAQGYQTFFMIVSSIVFLILLGYYCYETIYNKVSSRLFSIAMGLVFAGAIGNIIDRIMGKPGVVDFIYMGINKNLMWPAYNVADMGIVCGAFGLAYFFWNQEKKLRIEAKAADKLKNDDERI